LAIERGRLLIILGSRTPQTAAQLSRLAREDRGATLRHLQQLVQWGFIVGDGGDDIALYQLSPHQDTLRTPTAARRILVIEDNIIVRELVISILEDENYAVIASETPVAAKPLLGHAQFDLVITDGFHPGSTARFVDSIETIRAAGATPVALFSVQQVQLDAARVIGFRDVLAKPFDLETFLSQVRELLAPGLAGAKQRTNFATTARHIDAGSLAQR
jgi:CheY-like chemotaxis protein